MKKLPQFILQTTRRPFMSVTIYPHFGDFLISRRSEIQWAPHSPDMNPPDVYLWGYLNEHGYETKPEYDRYN